MALIKCPSCQREVSEKAAACPQCGHPISPPTTKTGGGGGGFFIFLVIVCLAAYFTKPDEAAIKKAIVDKGGILVGLAAGLVEVTGAGKFTYNDYLLFSTMTLKGANGTEKTVAAGFFGYVHVSGT